MCYCQTLNHTHIILQSLVCCACCNWSIMSVVYTFVGCFCIKSLQIIGDFGAARKFAFLKMQTLYTVFAFFVSSCSQASFMSGYELCIFIFCLKQILLTFYISDTVYCAFIKCGLLCVQRSCCLNNHNFCWNPKSVWQRKGWLTFTHMLFWKFLHWNDYY